jgi:hypothetical protein
VCEIGIGDFGVGVLTDLGAEYCTAGSFSVQTEDLHFFEGK